MVSASAIQMTSSDSIDENLKAAKALIAKAADSGSRLVVLPEMFAIMGMDENAKLQVAETYGQGKIQDFLSATARVYSIWIVGGTIPILTAIKNKVNATTLIFNENGQIVGRYDKIHLFDVKISETESYQESKLIEPGDSPCVIDSPIGRLGVAVCYDIRFPELFRKMRAAHTSVFAIPAAFTIPTGVAHWEVLARSRAIENFCYVVGACQGGTHSNGRKTYGHSLIVNPWGEVLATLSDQPGVITQPIDLQKLEEIRANIPVHLHRRFDI